MTSNQQAARELLPCPWCGGTVSGHVSEGSTFRWRKVDGCCADGPEIRHDTMADDQAAAEVESTQRAIDAWNERANPWLPIESAPKDGVVLLSVRGYEDETERRVYVAEMSYGAQVEHWIVTTGWTGWTRLHPAWEPVAWQPIPTPPDSGEK